MIANARAVRRLQRWHFPGIPKYRPKSAGTRRPCHVNPEPTCYCSTIESRAWNFQGFLIEEPRIFCRGTSKKKHFRRCSRNFIRASSLRATLPLTALRSAGCLMSWASIFIHEVLAGLLNWSSFATSYSDLTTSYKEFQLSLSRLAKFRALK